MIRPRISLRATLILVAIIASYFGFWDITRESGVGDFEDVFVVERTDELGFRTVVHEFDSSPAPFVLRRLRAEFDPPSSDSLGGQESFDVHEYHFWLRSSCLNARCRSNGDVSLATFTRHRSGTLHLRFN